MQGEEYKLMWKETVDFVRMASRLNTIIVPFGILGADDAYVNPPPFLKVQYCFLWLSAFICEISGY